MLTELSYVIPKWLAKALGIPKAQTLQHTDWPGFDHVRTYKKRVVISQAYEGNGHTCETLARLHQEGIKIRLWGVSPYFPGRTFSLILWRAEDEALVHEVCELMAQAAPTKPGPTNAEW